MNAKWVYSLLQDACEALDAAEDHAIAAHVGYAMSLVRDKYVVADQPDQPVRD